LWAPAVSTGNHVPKEDQPRHATQPYNVTHPRAVTVNH